MNLQNKMVNTLFFFVIKYNAYLYSSLCYNKSSKISIYSSLSFNLQYTIKGYLHRSNSLAKNLKNKAFLVYVLVFKAYPNRGLGGEYFNQLFTAEVLGQQTRRFLALVC